jgi:hypothetical protein
MQEDDRFLPQSILKKKTRTLSSLEKAQEKVNIFTY